MTTLTRDQIGAYASQAGFTGDNLNIAVAVALAESGGNPASHNAVPPDDSYGLWQINMLGSLGAPRRKQFGITNNAQLLDPATNAKAAHIIYTQSGWHAWTTYTSDKYKQFLKPVSSTAITLAANTTDTSSTDSGFLGIPGAINGIGQNLFNAAANLTGAIIAVVFIILGVLFLTRKQTGEAVGTIAKTAVKL